LIVRFDPNWAFFGLTSPERVERMTRGGASDSSIPWYSWLALIVVLGAGVTVFLVTHGRVFPPWLRWTMTTAWILLTLTLGAFDFILRSNPGGIDTKPFDRWTLSHGGAGLVFGVWYVPLVYVVLLTIAWEVFEVTVKGFGDKEIISNRVVDVGIALTLWLLVIAVGMAAIGAAFPGFAPVRMHG
jgi:hypothetical protein